MLPVMLLCNLFSLLSKKKDFSTTDLKNLKLALISFIIGVF